MLKLAASEAQVLNFPVEKRPLARIGRGVERRNRFRKQKGIIPGVPFRQRPETRMGIRKSAPGLMNTGLCAKHAYLEEAGVICHRAIPSCLPFPAFFSIP
jgi:hypothetical protein